MAGRRNGVTRVRRLLVGLATMSAAVVAVVVVGGAGVSATSCAMVSGYSWETIADGTAMFDVEGSQDPTPFFDVYDTVVIGEVVSIDGDGDGGGYPDGGYPDGVSVTLEVVGALRLDTVGSSYVIRQGDRGEMVGFPFAIGQTYMVPQRAGPPNLVNLCEAIIGVSPSNAEEALAIAAEAGVTVAFPDEAAAPGVSATVDGTVVTDVEETGSESAALRTLARWVGVALVAAVVGWFVRRRGRSERD